jgi:hypothetical protein
MSTEAVIDIPAGEYQRFRDLIGPDPELPATYQEWLTRRDEKIKALEYAGNVANVIVVTYQHFTKYLEDSGFPPSFFALGAAALSNLREQPSM